MRFSYRSVIQCGALLSLAVSIPVFSQSRVELPNSTPAYIHSAQDLGTVNPSGVITVTLQLKPSIDLDAALAGLYDSSSPNYHQWLSSSQTAAATSSVDSVKQFLSTYNLKLLSSSSDHISAQGRVADVQAAFNVSLHQYRVNGQLQRANTAAASVPAQVASTITSVSGLSSHRMSPHLMHPAAADGQRAALVPLAQMPAGAFYAAQCFRAPQIQSFSSSTATATYFGNRYGQDIDNTTFGTLPPCGYQPSDMWTAYNLSGLYSAGLDGTGQTIAIVDAFGSTSIQADVATFSAVYGLPAANLTVIGTPTATPYDADTNTAGWAEETTLDVEWAHAIAPGAKIVLIVSPDDSDANLSAGVALASTLPGVSVVSNSYGGPESTEDAPGFAAFEHANKINAAKGISVNYSSGDDGDWQAVIGYTDTGYPASSPYATGVGGVSVGVGTKGNITLQTGWGTNLTEIADTIDLGSPPIVPPNNEGFVFGAGGGPSGVFAKPGFQRFLPGRVRQEPDISWVADPYTGVEIILTADSAGDQAFTAIGGTSVACPMFSGLWAVANQAAGHKLGQAAPTLYAMDGNAITDVVPPLLQSLTDVSGLVKVNGSRAITYESAASLASPLENTRLFYSAFYNSPYSTRWFVITFGTDTSLTVTPGWDNVTGLGTPNGVRFVKEAVQLNH